MTTIKKLFSEKKHSGNLHKPDYWLILIIFILIAIGILMISSASVVIAKSIFKDSFYFLKKHLLIVTLGIIIFFIIQKIDYHFLEKWAPTMMLISLILLIAVFIPGLGIKSGGATRWVRLGPLSIQPTEILKIAFIAYLASWLEKKGKGIRNFSYGLLPFLIMLGFISILVIKQPDLGTLFVLASTAGIMFFVAGAAISQIIFGASIAGLVFWEFIRTANYRMARFMVFLNPSQDIKGAAYHINQALLAIGSGGLLGRGFNESRQKYFYLPEPFTDSIFAIISEEMGFLFSATIVVLFLIFAWRAFKIAKNAPDVFGRLLATGITCWIVLQAFINIGTMISILPMTGIPLPLISYGGSSFISIMFALGVLINISKKTVRQN